MTYVRSYIQKICFLHSTTLDEVKGKLRFKQTIIKVEGSMDNNDDEYDIAGRELLERLGLDPDNSVAGEYDNYNVIYKHKSGGCVYVGDQRAAK